MTQDVTLSAPADTATPAPTRSGLGSQLLWIGPTGLVVAVALSIAELVLVTSQPAQGGGALTALLALTMTLPVVLARRFPVAAAAIVAIAALANGLVTDDLVRCGGAFPAAIYIAFVIGSYARSAGGSWSRSVIGLVLVLANIVAQWTWDPALNVGAEFLGFGPPIVLAAWLVGLGVAAIRTRRAAR